MVSTLIFVLSLYFVLVSAIPMIIYDNASFDSTDLFNSTLDVSSPISSREECTCACYHNSRCITGTYFGINQTCVLSSAKLRQAQLRLTLDVLASVFSFLNRTTELDAINPPSMMQWLFDGNFDDVASPYGGHFVSNDANVTASSDRLWVSPGYNGCGSAVHFLPNTYYVVNQYFDLTQINFTVSAWISITFVFTTQSDDYFSLFSHCRVLNIDTCLHLVIANGNLRLGFYDDDLISDVVLKPDQWYHVAYVYDRSTWQQRIYLNGYLQQNRTPTYSYAGNSSRIILGPIPLIPDSNIHSGYIDKLIFVSRVKNASELLDEATLVAYYPFDGSYVDAGPNNINNTTYNSTTFDSSGRVNQALIFDLIATSYFQATGFYFLGQSNYPYSFALWIYPSANSGTVLQVSSSHGLCVLMIGFDQTGHLIIQTLGNKGLHLITGASPMLSSNTWTHVSMTYSPTSGIRLIVNGSLADFNGLPNNYAACGQMSTITLGTCLQSSACPVDQEPNSSFQFRGKIDELKIFSRELKDNEVSQLMGSVK